MNAVDRVTQYCYDVLNGEIIAGELVKLACKRHLDDLERSKIAVFKYEFDIEKAEKEFTIKRFDNADEEWLSFVVNNRKGNIIDSKTDIHIGPVADDNVYQSIRLFETGAYDAEYTVRKLKTEVLHDQWTLHSDEILKYLNFIEAKEVR